MKNSLKHGLILFLAVVTASLTLVSCGDDSNVPMPPPLYDLEIYLYQNAAPEIIAGRTIRIGGTLKDAQANPLSGHLVYFSVFPDSLGNITPADHAYTNPTDSAGFDERVLFTARKLGFGYLEARFYYDEVLRDVDTLHIQVRDAGNF